jgi:hypothetical protein
MRRFAYVLAAFLFLVVRAAGTQEVAPALSAEQVQEAIRLASDDKAAGDFSTTTSSNHERGGGTGR